MRAFSCGGCGNRIYFENVRCTRCGATLGFLPDKGVLVALEPAGNGLWREPGGAFLYRMCANYSDQAVCNWMRVPENVSGSFCMACELNQTIPDLSQESNRTLWKEMESSKRRLVYSLLRLNLSLQGLRFDFLADTPPSFVDSGRVLTGHEGGLITLNIAEADPVERERMREQMDEPYRTLLGHFRHESGHFFWDRLVRNRETVYEFRRFFGDERLDYSQELERHHQQGPPPNWRDQYVSAYASCHPWEDWAESWAHVLHILDTLETAVQFGVSLPSTDTGSTVRAIVDPYTHSNFQDIFDQWVPLTFALNSLNRSMGHEDAYPFVLAPPVMEKLALVHSIMHNLSPVA
jgi:hypothetical protein